MRLVNIWVDGFFVPVNCYEANGVWWLSALYLGHHYIDAHASHASLGIAAGMLRESLSKFGAITHKSPLDRKILDSAAGMI